MSISARQVKYFPLLFVLYEIASYLSNDAYLPAMPLIQEQLKTTDDMVRLSLTTWFLGGCLVQLFVGPIADYIGRRKVLLAGGAVFLVSTIGCAVSPTIDWLVWMRFIEGITIATMAVTGYATIHDMYDTKQSIQIIAFINSISVLAPAFGPLVGAASLQFMPWQAIFYVLAIMACLPLMLLYVDMPETANVKATPLRLKNVLTSYKRILLNPMFMLYLVASRFIFASMIVWLSAGPFLLDDVYHVDTVHFGIAQVFIFGSYIVGSRLNKVLIEKYSLSALIWQGWGYSLLGCIYLFGSGFTAPDSFYSVVPGLMLITMGAGLSLPIYSRLAIEQSSEPMGAKVSMTTFATTLFGVLATIAVNIFFTNSLWSLIFIVTGCIISGFLLFLLARGFAKKA